MKRSEALKLIANQLDFLNGKFEGFRTKFTKSELKNADVILTTLEHSGMRPPLVIEAHEDLSGYVQYVNVDKGWENE